MTRWLVVGSAGQLGHDLMDVLGPPPSSPDTAAAVLDPLSADVAIGLDLPDIDITDPGSVRDALAEHRPDVVVNAAAYTAVDAAESDEETAHRVNAVGPAVLARACAEQAGTRMVQLSTDYVFPGDPAEVPPTPYDEDAPTGPCSAYGRTKLAGEQAVLSELRERSYIVRTAWLYGEHGNNFVKTMLRLAGEHPTVPVVADQTGQPTWSHDLAEQLVLMVRSDAPVGIYHGTNSGQTTWHGLTREIFRLAGHDPERVLPTTTAAFPRPAPRPAYSVLGHRRWQAAGLAEMRPWQDALAEALPTIRRQLESDGKPGSVCQARPMVG